MMGGMGEEFLLKWHDHRASFFHHLEDMVTREQLTDVTLGCGDTILHAHSLMLSVCSPYFRSLLLENCHREKHHIVHLNGIKPRHMQQLLVYMYRGEISICKDDLGPLIETARCLQIKGLSLATTDVSNSYSHNTKKRSPSQLNEISTDGPSRIKERRLSKPKVKSGVGGLSSPQGTAGFGGHQLPAAIEALQLVSGSATTSLGQPDSNQSSLVVKTCSENDDLKSSGEDVGQTTPTLTTVPHLPPGLIPASSISPAILMSTVSSPVKPLLRPLLPLVSPTSTIPPALCSTSSSSSSGTTSLVSPPCVSLPTTPLAPPLPPVAVSLPLLPKPLSVLKTSETRTYLSKLIWLGNGGRRPQYGNPDTKPCWWPQHVLPWEEMKKMGGRKSQELSHINYTEILKQCLAAGYEFFGYDPSTYFSVEPINGDSSDQSGSSDGVETGGKTNTTPSKSKQRSSGGSISDDEDQVAQLKSARVDDEEGGGGLLAENNGSVKLEVMDTEDTRHDDEFKDGTEVVRENSDKNPTPDDPGDEKGVRHVPKSSGGGTVQSSTDSKLIQSQILCK